MPTTEEIRDKARKQRAEELLSWAIGHEGHANLVLTARLVVAIEMLEEAVKEQSAPLGT